MEPEKIKELIEECFTIIWFKYKGVVGNVEPWYDPKTKEFTYAMVYDDKETLVHTIDDAMKLPFINGKCLEEVAEQLEWVDW